jgi:iron(III) transport system permease protein
LLAVAYQHWLNRLTGRATITGKSARLQPRLRTKWSYVASAILLLYIGVSIFLPLSILVLGSFNKLFGFFFIKSPWTLDHWADVFTNPAFTGAAANSIVVGLSVGLIGTLIYALLAWVLTRTTVWGRDVLALLVWLPWAIPGLVLGITLLSILLNVPIISPLYGTIIPLVAAMIIKDLPIGVQMLRSSLYQLSPDLEESAKMSGAGFGVTFWRVTLPSIAPMCIAVFLLVFMATLRDISTIVLLSSPGSRTLSMLMFEYATASRLEAAAVIGVLIAIISLVITSIAFRIGLKATIEQ